jgi:hypothetical protein
MAKRRQPLTQERANRVIDSIGTIKALARMIEYEHAYECDVNFKNPNTHNHVKRILESATAIYNSTASVLGTTKGTEEQGAEYIAQVMRMIKFTLQHMPLDVLIAYNDGLENIDKEQFKIAEVTA